jgi:hypothetical protein
MDFLSICPDDADHCDAVNQDNKDSVASCAIDGEAGTKVLLGDNHLDRRGCAEYGQEDR